MSQPYLYKPLEKGQIRLLTVWIDESEPHGLVLSLRQVLLDDVKGKYEALSYTWGRPEPLDHDPTYQPDKIWELKCGGGIMRIRQNLFDFFQQMRRMGSDILSLWIDAVCIDQKNDVEKSEQVLRMGQIYSSSRRVVIWLGSRPITFEAQQIIKEFIPVILKDFDDRDFDPDFYGGLDILDQNSSDPLIQVIGYEKWVMWKTSWQQYCALFTRSWFERGWTVQEAALQTPGRCYVLVGPDIIPWKSILEFGFVLVQSGWAAELEYSGPEGRPFVSMARRVEAHRDRRFYARKPLQIYPSIDATTQEHKWYTDCLKLIIDMADMSVENPRDKIYAYLGIMLRNKPAWIENSIVPDYTVDEVLVYQNFATVILQNVPHLEVLELTQSRGVERNPKLPSWVPDFANLPARLPKRFYNASMGRHDSMNIPAIMGNYLTIRGAQFTSISSQNVLESLSTDPQDRLATFSLLPGKYVGSGECMPEAVWRTALQSTWRFFDTDNRRPRATVRHWLLQRLWNLWHQGREQESLLQRLWNLWHQGREQESLSMLLAPVAHDYNLKKWLPTLEEVKVPNAPSPDDVFDDLLKAALFRSEIYHMTSGHFGIGPRSLCLGDQVWILEGGDFPFVLRQNENNETYTLLGYMRVYGIMYGEAMTDEFRSRFGPVTIV